MNLQHIRKIESVPNPDSHYPSFRINDRFLVICFIRVDDLIEPLVIRRRSVNERDKEKSTQVDKLNVGFQPVRTSAEALVNALIKLNAYIESSGDSDELDFLIRLAEDGWLSEEGWIFAPWGGDKYELIRFRDKPYKLIKRIEQDVYPHKSKDVYSCVDNGWRLFHDFILTNPKYHDKLIRPKE